MSWLFFKIDLCSAISFKRSRWELSIDVAEHTVGRRWKITKIRTTPVWVSYSKQAKHSHKRGGGVSLWRKLEWLNINPSDSQWTGRIYCRRARLFAERRRKFGNLRRPKILAAAAEILEALAMAPAHSREERGSATRPVWASPFGPAGPFGPMFCVCLTPVTGPPPTFGPRTDRLTALVLINSLLNARRARASFMLFI